MAGREGERIFNVCISTIICTILLPVFTTGQAGLGDSATQGVGPPVGASTVQPLPAVVTEEAPQPSRAVTTQYVEQQEGEHGIVDHVEEEEQPKPHTQTEQGGGYPSTTQQPSHSNSSLVQSQTNDESDTKLVLSSDTRGQYKPVDHNVTEEPPGLVHIQLLPNKSNISLVQSQLDAAQKALEQAKSRTDQGEAQGFVHIQLVPNKSNSSLVQSQIAAAQKALEQSKAGQEQSETTTQAEGNSKVLFEKPEHQEQSVLPKAADETKEKIAGASDTSLDDHAGLIPNHQLLQFVSTQGPPEKDAAPIPKQEEPATGALGPSVPKSNETKVVEDIAQDAVEENPQETKESEQSPQEIVKVSTQTFEQPAKATTQPPSLVHQSQVNGEDEYFLKPKVDVKDKNVGTDDDWYYNVDNVPKKENSDDTDYNDKPNTNADKDKDAENFEYNDDLDMDRKTAPDDDDYYINDDYWIQEKVNGNEKAALEKTGKSQTAVAEAPVSMLMFYCWMALITFIVIIGFTALRNRHRVLGLVVGDRAMGHMGHLKNNMVYAAEEGRGLLTTHPHA